MERLTEILSANKNEDNAYYMSKYMKFKFSYLGIKTPERRALTKEFVKDLLDGEVKWDFITWCFQQEEREYQYVALNYLDKVKDKLEKSDISKLESLILTKSWWDTVDSIAPIVGFLARKYPQIKNAKIKEWVHSESIWLIRTSIIFQLKYKEETDYDFLSYAIKNNLNTGEFFIDKAIGWQLRELSKINKNWVKVFIDENQLSKLSIREGSKYI